jgi:hypothetical protein
MHDVVPPRGRRARASIDDVVPSKTDVEGRSFGHAGREFAKEGTSASSPEASQEMVRCAKERAPRPFTLQRKTRPTRPARGCSTVRPESWVQLLHPAAGPHAIPCRVACRAGG